MYLWESIYGALKADFKTWESTAAKNFCCRDLEAKTHILIYSDEN